MFNFKKSLIYVILSESSIHGCLHVMIERRHLLERLLWILFITLSIYCTTKISFDQWSRFQNNPTVLSIQTNYKNWQCETPSATYCSNYTNEAEATNLIKEIWNISENHPKYNYYYHYVVTVATTKYNNLNRYENYINDESLLNTDLLRIATSMKQKVPQSNKNFNYVITELGMCFSSTKLHHFQNPYKNFSVITNNEWNNKTCTYLDVCKKLITFDDADDTDVRMFLHTVDDVISLSHEPSIDLNGLFQTEIIMSIRVIKASEALRNIDPERRKCYFYSESVLEYFDVYTVNLCQIECRIKKAINLCGCRPFFYNIEKEVLVCDAAGMYCLHQKNWSSTTCKCLKLCEETIFVINNFVAVKTFNSDRTVVLTNIFPKTRILCGIIFSFEDLIVSFGGAASLFLGFSVISGVEILFFLFEYIIKYTIKVVKLFYKFLFSGPQIRVDSAF